MSRKSPKIVPSVALVCTCFVFISKQIATFAPYDINWLVLITAMKSVLCAVWVGLLNKRFYALSLSSWQCNARLLHCPFRAFQWYELQCFETYCKHSNLQGAQNTVHISMSVLILWRTWGNSMYWEWCKSWTIGFYNCELPDDGPARHETCRSLRIKTLL
jgi:hypothetical protein